MFWLRRRWERLLFIAFVLSWSVGCDQATKRVAEQRLKGTPMRSMWNDTFRLHYVENTGAFLGFGAHFSNEVKRWSFVIFPIVTLAGMLLFGIFSRRLARMQLLMLMLIVGGGLSNLLDRLLFHGRVTDFMNMGIGSLRTGIFNIADVAILGGIFGFWLLSIWGTRHENNPPSLLPDTLRKGNEEHHPHPSLPDTLR